MSRPPACGPIGIARVVGLALCVWATLASAQNATVRHAIDGDSVVLVDGRQVRLIGINAPELGVDGRPDQPLARAAQARMAQLTEGRSVTLTFDRETSDRHGRTLAYLMLADGTDVQARILTEGLAWCVAIPPNTARAEAYCAAERAAHAGNRGVWAETQYRPIPAAQLGTGDTGFRLVEGRVHRIGRGAHAVYLDLAPRVSVVIPLDAWRDFPRSARPQSGQTLVARGWVTEYKNGLRLRIAHPAMLEILR